jgi:hypothetical protein
MIKLVDILEVRRITQIPLIAYPKPDNPDAILAYPYYFKVGNEKYNVGYYENECNIHPGGNLFSASNEQVKNQVKLAAFLSSNNIPFEWTEWGEAIVDLVYFKLPDGLNEVKRVDFQIPAMFNEDRTSIEFYAGEKYLWQAWWGDDSRFYVEVDKSWYDNELLDFLNKHNIPYTLHKGGPLSTCRIDKVYFNIINDTNNNK